MPRSRQATKRRKRASKPPKKGRTIREVTAFWQGYAAALGVSA